MKIKLSVVKWDGQYWPKLQIGVQFFKFGRGCETKETAEWYCESMKMALRNLCSL